jgi:hypothetical protein
VEWLKQYELLCSKDEVLSSNPSVARKEKKEENPLNTRGVGVGVFGNGTRNFQLFRN